MILCLMVGVVAVLLNIFYVQRSMGFHDHFYILQRSKICGPAALLHGENVELKIQFPCLSECLRFVMRV